MDTDQTFQICNEDTPNPELDRIWAEEAEVRLQAYREGRTKPIPVETVLGESL